MPRWVSRPPGSTWGDFGENDTKGRLNLLTPEKVLQGIAEIREGRTFCLCFPLDIPKINHLVHPQRQPPLIEPTKRADGKHAFNQPGNSKNKALTSIGCDDIVHLTLQFTTQWDALSHVGSMWDISGKGKPVHCYYNGYLPNVDIVGPVAYHSDGTETTLGEHKGALKLGVENLAEKPIQGRAVLIDLEHYYGRGRTWIGYKEIQHVLKSDNIVVEKGDMVCLHTGFGAMILEENGEPSKHMMENSCAVLDGRDPQLLQWVTDTGLVSLIADNFAVEGLPSRPPPNPDLPHHPLPLHEHCLFKLGVNLGEFWYLSDLAKYLRQEITAGKRQGGYRFFLTAPPLHLPRAVGSPANAIATA
ncbi:hypothetical protein M427DRAFT_52107 [Gonapodya prolifera JEL478]|uniref:Cyclase n=1 Tax=Gonapodya prolifera (strain JEL478) TaxID=1344416 RepID=A0A139AUT7_GONPJ|nr:hypothetical protein M427DRAFT_52107 [Gonapodya prolifera JEL478]|eukprot:KXS20500.1 hypothetical protein M427DRAFT_52107 [Gonapodya prolifera JEL478]